MINRWYILSVLACWSAAMGWLFVEKILPTLYEGDPPEYSEVLPASDAGPRRVCWEIYFQGEPIGEASGISLRHEDGSGKIENHVHFQRLPVGAMLKELLGSLDAVFQPLWGASGRKDNIEMTVDSDVHVGSDGRLDSFVTNVDVADLDIRIRVEGEVHGSKLDVAVFTTEGDEMRVRYRDQIDLPDQAVVSGSLTPSDRLANLYEGQTWTVPVYRPFPPNSPLQMVQAKVERKSVYVWNNQSLMAYQVVYRDDAGSGISLAREPIGKMWVREDGEVLLQDVRMANMHFRFIRLPDETCVTR